MIFIFWLFAGKDKICKNPAKNCCLFSLQSEGLHYWVLSKNGNVAGLIPTSKLPTHLLNDEMLIATKRDELVVVHTHPNNLISLIQIEKFCDEKLNNKLLGSIQPDTCVFKSDGLGFVKYLMTGTKELIMATILAMQNHRMVLWKTHGCLAKKEGSTHFH